MKKIIMTGGGTAGHVTPNLALVPLLKEKGYEIFYIGSYTGIEKKLVEDAGITYYGISSGKLRRYHDWKNFTDPFRVIKGFSEANQLMKHIQPDVVFSKGGFVSVPVVMAAARQHIPAIIHESDMTPGLANKLAIPFASKVCCNFPETMQYLPDGKAVHTGSPIRKELFSGNKEAGLSFTGFSADKPVILIMGGSIGSRFINNAVWASLDTLLEKFQIVHLVGKGNINNDLVGRAGYKQYEFISEQLNDIFAMTDLMISRAGANSISEILALKIPNILLNAASYEKQGFSTVLQEEELTGELLVSSVEDVYARRDEIKEKMASSKLLDANNTIMNLIENTSSVS